jgi:hypothetical protein
LVLGATPGGRWGHFRNWLRTLRSRATWQAADKASLMWSIPGGSIHQQGECCGHNRV